MRSRYDLTQTSGVRSTEGTLYPDICTIAIDKFRYTSTPDEYTLDMIDIKRLDILCANLYGVSEFDDLLLWINNIADPTTMTVGQIILVPTKSDMESFYYVNRK